MRSNSHVPITPATELHLDVKQISALWRLDPKTVTSLFRNEEDVLRVKSASRVTLRIPLSVAERVHRRMSQLE